jgi:hypothetical protein
MPANFLFEGHGYRTIRSMIGPKATIRSDTITADGSEIARMQAGELHFYIWGFAEYKDIIGSEISHQTRFCYKVFCLGDPRRHNAPDNVVEFRFVHHPRFNCADDECNEQDVAPIQSTI